MTPPNQNYTLSLNNLTSISYIYNNFLKNKVKKSRGNFCLLSDIIKPNLDYLYDDCHFTENGSKKVSEVLFNCINLDSILN